MMTPVFPFTAIVGQELMRIALILTTIDPRIGGVLIRGERGTGKSIAARGLAALLPLTLERSFVDAPLYKELNDSNGPWKGFIDLGLR